MATEKLHPGNPPNDSVLSRPDFVGQKLRAADCPSDQLLINGEALASRNMCDVRSDSDFKTLQLRLKQPASGTAVIRKTI
jgi:hypothetical protein